MIKQGLLSAGLTSSTAMTGLQPLSATATKAPASLCSPSTTSTLGLISLGAPCKQLRCFEQPNVICLSVFLFIKHLRKSTGCTLVLPTSSVVGCCIALHCFASQDITRNTSKQAMHKMHMPARPVTESTLFRTNEAYDKPRVSPYSNTAALN